MKKIHRKRQLAGLLCLLGMMAVAGAAMLSMVNVSGAIALLTGFSGLVFLVYWVLVNVRLSTKITCCSLR